jgi:hypothetical protein
MQDNAREAGSGAIALVVLVFRGKESPVFWLCCGYFNRHKVMEIKIKWLRGYRGFLIHSPEFAP